MFAVALQKLLLNYNFGIPVGSKFSEIPQGGTIVPFTFTGEIYFHGFYMVWFYRGGLWYTD